MFIVKFVADYSMGRVLVEQIGSNKSAVNDDSMIKGEKRLLYHGDKVSLLFKSNYTFRLDFITSPSYGVATASNKRPTGQSNEDTSPKKSRPEDKEKWQTWDGTLLVYNSLNLNHNDKVSE